MLDRAVHAVRDDLADVELADRVFAPHYARSTLYRVIAGTSVYIKPNLESEQIGTVMIGDSADIFDLSGGWAWVRVTAGIGYLPANTVTPA